MKKMPDWLIRAIKTFVQAFFGVLVPEVVLILRDGWPESWTALWGVLAPVAAAALAAAISAVWNILLERLESKTLIRRFDDVYRENIQAMQRDEGRGKPSSGPSGHLPQGEGEGTEERIAASASPPRNDRGVWG